MVDALRTHRQNQRIERLDGLIFTTLTGRPLDPKPVHERLQELLRAAGMAPYRVHDLRHAAASAWLASGVPIRAVADMLGHSDVRMTLGTYAHSLPEITREAARRIDEYVTEKGA